MLEERLSKAYSQHTLGGYNLPNSRQAPSPYPTLSSTASNPSGAENFYSGEPPQNFGQPTVHNYDPRAQYANYDKRSSISMPSNSQYPPHTTQRNENYHKQTPLAPPHYPTQPNFVPLDHTPTPSQSNHLSQPSPQTPHNQVREPAASPSVDPNGAYYPNLHQPSNFTRQSVPPTPASTSIQPAQPVPQPSQPAQPAQPYQQVAQPNSLPYWHQQQNAGHPSHVYQAEAPRYGGYNQDPFPSAPQHAPQQSAVEESLIDL